MESEKFPFDFIGKIFALLAKPDVFRGAHRFLQCFRLFEHPANWQNSGSNPLPLERELAEAMSPRRFFRTNTPLLAPIIRAVGAIASMRAGRYPQAKETGQSKIIEGSEISTPWKE